MKLIRFLKSVGRDIGSGIKKMAIGIGVSLLAMTSTLGSLFLVGWVLSFWVSPPVTSSPMFMMLIVFGMAEMVILFCIVCLIYWIYLLARWLVNSWKNA